MKHRKINIESESLPQDYAFIDAELDPVGESEDPSFRTDLLIMLAQYHAYCEDIPEQIRNTHGVLYVMSLIHQINQEYAPACQGIGLGLQRREEARGSLERLIIRELDRVRELASEHPVQRTIDFDRRDAQRAFRDTLSQHSGENRGRRGGKGGRPRAEVKQRW